MKWVTRSHVHVDRVACPWLITRFVDSDAEFVFLPVGEIPRLVEEEGAVPFDSPGGGTRASRLPVFFRCDSREIQAEGSCSPATGRHRQRCGHREHVCRPHGCWFGSNRQWLQHPLPAGPREHRAPVRGVRRSLCLVPHGSQFEEAVDRRKKLSGP